MAGTPRNDVGGLRPQLGATYPADFYMKIESDGTQIKGYYSTDGTDWTLVGRPANLPANAKVGVFALDNAAATHVTAKFDYFQLDGGSGRRRQHRPRRRVRRHLAQQDDLELDRPRGPVALQGRAAA